MLNKITKLFQPKEKPTTFVKHWREGMWVVFNGKPAILHKIASSAEIHIVDATSGETIEVQQVSLDALTQAHYDEIPQVRRKISREQAKELGYGT